MNLNKTTRKKMKKSIIYYALSSLVVSGMALSAISCGDNDLNPNQEDDNVLVRFSVNNVQELAIGRGLEMTRGAIATGISGT